MALFLVRHIPTGHYVTKGKSKEPRIYISKSSAGCERNKRGQEWEIVSAKVVQCDKLQNIRPSWDNYFLGLALLASKRSHDVHTQVGCIVVDNKHRILGIGYNGFPRGMDNLPTTRPEKYEWMIHSEINAVNNCSIRPEGATAYITIEPCHNCLMHLWQNGITKVIHDTKHSSLLINDQTRKNKQVVIDQTGIEIIPVKADLSWLWLAVLPA